MNTQPSTTNQLLRIGALVGPMLQFAVSLASIFFNDFGMPLDEKYGLPERLYLQPSGIAFAIWNFIFIWFIIMGFHQFKLERKDDPMWVKARPYIVASTLANSIWLIADAYALTGICLVAFVVMLVSLIRLYVVIGVAKRKFEFKERLQVKYAVSIFFGWISFAFPIGITIWLMSFFQISGNEVLGPAIWSSILVGIACCIFLSLYLTKTVTTAYVMVGIWGLFWLYVRTSYYSELLSNTAIISAGLLFMAIVLRKGMALMKRSTLTTN